MTPNGSHSTRNVLIGAAWVGARGARRVARVSLAPARLAVRLPGAGRPLALLEEVGRREQERARDATERALDTALHRALESRRVSELAERVVASPAMQRVLDGPVVDRFVVALIEARVVERVTAELIAADVPEHVVGQVLEARVLDEVVTRLLADDALAQTVEGLLTRWFEGPLYEDVIDGVLASEEFWQLVDQIAKSPEVMDAITAGSASLVGEVADEVRERTIAADDIAERVTRKVLRRAPRKDTRALPPGDGGLPPGGGA